MDCECTKGRKCAPCLTKSGTLPPTDNITEALDVVIECNSGELCDCPKGDCSFGCGDGCSLRARPAEAQGGITAEEARVIRLLGGPRHGEEFEYKGPPPFRTRELVGPGWLSRRMQDTFYWREKIAIPIQRDGWTKAEVEPWTFAHLAPEARPDPHYRLAWCTLDYKAQLERQMQRLNLEIEEAGGWYLYRLHRDSGIPRIGPLEVLRIEDELARLERMLDGEPAWLEDGPPDRAGNVE